MGKDRERKGQRWVIVLSGFALNKAREDSGKGKGEDLLSDLPARALRAAGIYTDESNQ